MQITINTDQALSATDEAILRAYLAQIEWPGQGEQSSPEPEKAPAKPSTRKRASKPAQAEEKPSEAAPEPEETTPKPEADEPVSDEDLEKAVSLASAAVQDGNKAQVRAALKAAGAARVGAIETASQAARFIAAMKK